MNAQLSALVTEDSVESYDDDLAWILEKLVGRTGGVAGGILRQIDAAEKPRLLALHGAAAAAPDEDQCFLKAARLAFERKSSDAGSNPVVEKFDVDGRSCTLVMLWFRPAANVRILAAVSVPNILQEMQARIMAAKLSPVLERYVRLWWMHRRERQRADTFGAALELSDIGVLLLDRRGAVIFSNQMAEKLLSMNDGLVRGFDSLVARHLDDAARLQAALQSAVALNRRGGAPEGDEWQQAPLFTVRRESKARPLILTVLAVRRRAVDPDDAAAIVYVLDPQHDMRDLVEPARHIYRLTDTEAKLVARLVKGLTLLEAARDMGVAEATARTYLKQIFGKTGTNRQTDLVRLMLASRIRANVGKTPAYA